MPLVTVAEAAEELSVSSDRLYELIRERKIRSYRFGPRSTRVDVTEIKAATQQQAEVQTE